MIYTHELKKRDLYLRKIIAFRDTEPVKVVTGIRRCGKSSLLKLMVEHLKETGVSDEQIIEMNFESHEFKKMSADDFYEYVQSKVVPGKRMYLFFDELQRIDKWEETVNSFRVDFNCDIYITGSNAYLLSSEYSTYLSGRCVEIKMLPLSFSEFLYFHDFEVKETKSALGGTRLQVFDKSGERYELREVFDAYMRFGGMPGIADVGLDQEKALVLLDGIYSTVIVRDILEREKRRGQRQITDPVCFEKLSCSLLITLEAAFRCPPLEIRWSTKVCWRMGSERAHPAPTRCKPMSMLCWSPISTMISSASTSRAKNILEPLASII